MSDKMKVIYKVFPEGDVIALFPEFPGDMNPYETCESYQHIGQHGAASVGLASLRPATPTEVDPLRLELESIGYNNLRQAYRFTRSDLQKRIAATIR